MKHMEADKMYRKNVRGNRRKILRDHIYPTPPLGQDMTQGQFLSGV